jgi:L-fuconate dehydratase
VKTLCSEYLAHGFTAFKVKVGQNLEDDRRRCAMVREIIGWDNKLVCTNTLQSYNMYQSLQFFTCRHGYFSFKNKEGSGMHRVTQNSVGERVVSPTDGTSTLS